MKTKPLAIGVVNVYCEAWYEKCLRGERSRGHLWGLDTLIERGHAVEQLRSRDGTIASWLGIALTRLTRNQLVDFAADFAAIKAGRRFDLIYVSYGDLFFYLILKRLGLVRARVAIWKYESPRSARFPTSVFVRLYNRFFRAVDGVCCLTTAGERAYRATYPQIRSQFVDWGADIDYLKPARELGSYFLSTGVTRRDLETLIRAANLAEAPCVIIGPEELEPMAGPTIRYIPRKRGAHPHDTVTDEELQDLYRGSRAILVPLYDIPRDTSGLTTIVEALAEGKAVIKTKSGALDIDVEALGAGIHTRPGNVDDWVAAFRTLMDDDAARAMGRAAREAAERHYNTERFGRDLADFLESLAEPRDAQPETDPLAARTSRRAAISASSLQRSSRLL